MLLLFFTCTQLQLHAQSVDSLFTTLYENYAFNGNVLIAEKGHAIYSHSFGFANVEDSLKNSEATRFHLASVSKIFTSTAILQLKEAGKLKLDAPVVEYLPDFPIPAITIRHLLSHTSGLPDFQVFEAPHAADTSKIFSNADIIPALKGWKQPLPAPGERWSYSNTGYAVLSLVIEKLSGMHYQDYLQQHIFKRSGMTNTYIQTALIPVPDASRATWYDFHYYAPGELIRVDAIKSNRIATVILGGIIGPGNIVSTTGDLLRFDEALYAGKLLKPATLAEAFTPTRLNNGEQATTGNSYYGLGWMILRDTSMGKIVWHSGGAAGIVTVFMRNITRHQLVILLDNVTHRNVHGDGVRAMYMLNHKTLKMDKKSLAAGYVQVLFKKGVDAAMTKFNQLKDDTAHFYMDERELNWYGLELLWNGGKALGLEALKINTLLYPGSWNVYDSYAQALLLNGHKQEAVVMYEKSIAMNPDNRGGREALEQIK
jgi:CubicO group peptidase (beta-lactamase class C family)